MRTHKLLVLSLILATIIVAPIIYVSMLYLEGDVANYELPQPPFASSSEQVQADLQNLAQAMDAYFIKNLEYPQKLEFLQPEFLERVACDPLNGKPYLYSLYKTEGDGISQYRITVPDPKLYGAKEFYIEDGKIFKN